MSNQKLLNIAYFLYQEKKDSAQTYICNNLKPELSMLEFFKILPSLPISIYELFQEDGENFIFRNRIVQNYLPIHKIASFDELNKSLFEINIVFAENFEKDSIRNFIVISKKHSTDISHKLINIKDLSPNNIYLCIEKLSDHFSTKNNKDYLEIKHLSTNLQSPLYKRQSISEFSNNIIFGDDTEEENRNILHCFFNKKALDKLPDYSSIDLFLSLNSFYTEKLIKNMSPDLKNNFITKNYLVIKDNSFNLEFNANKNQYSQNGIKEICEDSEELFEALKIIKSIQDDSINEKITNKYLESYILGVHLKKVAIRFYSALTASPILKSTLTNNMIFSQLNDVAIQCRDKNKNISKYSKLPYSNIIPKRIMEISDIIKTSLGVNIKYLKTQYVENIKIFSNLPLEFLHINNLPLMIRHNISRIPVTPGYLLSKFTYNERIQYFTTETFKKVLIISSFKEDDSLKEDLPKALEPFKLHNTFLEISYHSVKNNNDVQLVLQKNDPDFLILNMHGGHGILDLSEEPLDLNLFKSKTPSVVLLSACDTSPIDENQYSTANTFLSSGAQCVISSALPIISVDSAEFIARLLFRIASFMKMDTSITLLEIIGGMQRRKYFSDLLQILSNEKRIKYTKEFMGNILMIVDTPHAQDIDKAIKEIADHFQLTTEELNNFIKEKYSFPESLKYTLLGNPENIFFVQENKVPLITIES